MHHGIAFRPIAASENLISQQIVDRYTINILEICALSVRLSNNIFKNNRS